MIDAAKKSPIKIIPRPLLWPRLDVSDVQLDSLKHLLDANKIRYWVSEDSISVNGGPYYSEVHFSRGADPDALQRVLDSVN